MPRAPERPPDGHRHPPAARRLCRPPTASPRRSRRPCSTGARASSASTRCSSASRSTPSTRPIIGPETVHLRDLQPVAWPPTRCRTWPRSWPGPGRCPTSARSASSAGAEVGPLALLARPVLEGLARTAIDLGGFDYGDGSTPVPPGLDLPGRPPVRRPEGRRRPDRPRPALDRRGRRIVRQSLARPGLRTGRTLPPRSGSRRRLGDPSAIAKWIDSGE